MAKAIVGTYADPRTIALLGEVRALRARVATLEKALEEAELALAAREAAHVDHRQERGRAAGPAGGDIQDSEARPLDPAGSVIA